ncbi:hypothetical protein JCGZ_08742 [Jatropha curcas]|uniref:Nuclear transcription factor Y subunit n=1 Tax=Jatropha curcas TaxID=180498 RepID=A0A067KM65_JATCU|nr:nuclear transcription factor Y subunit A-10 [Jatropha curcas]KDP36098.1 hypothetical protein JCGZ_08742 [Jatropha curcas]
MAVKTLFFKENDGIVHNPIGQLSSVPSIPWWSNLGPQSAYGESFGSFKLSSMEQSIGGDQVTAMKQARRGTEQGLDIDKGNTTQFTMFSGDCKTSNGGQKSPQTAMSLQKALPEHCTHIDLGFSPSMIYAKYPHVDQCYGVFSTYGPQISGRIMLPMNMTTDDGPIFVNPKQYHGIIRRRRTRAKAVLENKSTRKRKPFMHLSRHLHAMRRPRGNGGRFLNTKNSNGTVEIEAKNAGGVQLSQPAGSQSSEVLQSDSSKDHGGSNLSGAEVTSMYSRRNFDHFSINHLAPPLHSFSVIMDTGHNVVMPNKWDIGAAAT